jgi:protein O-GlcNAc transferase
MNAVPNPFVALCEHGDLLQQQGRFEAAVASYTQALQDRPHSAAALTNRGNALRALGRLSEALADLDTALAIRPVFPEALNNRGNVLRDLGMLPAALESFERALQLRPDFLMALCNRGKTLLDLARCQEALDSFATALQLDPADGEALFGHASARLRLGQDLALAAEEFEHSSACGIPRAEALVGRAASWAALERHTEAADCIEELLRLAPDWEYARGALLHSRLKTCDWRDLSVLVEDACQRVARGERASHPHSLLALSDSPQLQLACARAVSRHKFPPATQSAGSAMRSTRPARLDARVRVAYVSADFSDHPVPQLLIGTLERHDRTRFEIIGVSLRAGRGHPFERRIRQAFDGWIDAAALTPPTTASRLRDAGVDIAVDLMGFTEGMRLEAFAHRAAPVQVNYLGYAGSTGSPYMDYILTDATVIPPGTESAYSEHVVRLPHCFLPNDDRRRIALPPTRTQAGLPDNAFVFCAFTSAHKVNPPLFDVWMRLLFELPGSVLWMRGADIVTRTNLAREATVHGINPARLVFASAVSEMPEHLARLSLADLYLDTFPYNAHSTACDALWAGVPVLTCAGRGFASRVAASALHAAGLPQLITASLGEYEAAALRLARAATAQCPEEPAGARTRTAATVRHRPLHPHARGRL